jgi:HAD superfamily hydrolase (TIGR01509 family)
VDRRASFCSHRTDLAAAHEAFTTERHSLLRALIFDFDGVLVDSEPLIFKITAQMAAQEGWVLTEEDYYRNYLALDDRGIIEHLYQSHGQKINLARRDELIAWKFRTYAEAIRDGLPALPGSVEFVRRVAVQFPLAIASGSLRSEVEHLLTKIGLRDSFQFLVTAEDTARSKPDPEIFLKALAALSRLPQFQTTPLQASECLVIEDAPAGVRAAHSAGMKCLALTHSRPADELRHADWLCVNISDVNLGQIEAFFR